MANLVANVVHGANTDGGDVEVEVLEVLRKASPNLNHQENDHLLAHDPHERRQVLLAQRATVPSKSRSRSGIIGRSLSATAAGVAITWGSHRTMPPSLLPLLRADIPRGEADLLLSFV